MEILETAILTNQQKETIFRLWNQEYAQKLNHKEVSDFEKYLESVKEHFHYLLVNDSAEIVGWAFKFTRDDDRWFSILVDRTEHGKGKGTLMLNKLKEQEELLSGWVVDHENDKTANGAQYVSPVNFYLKNGFHILPAVRLETEKLSAVKMVWVKD